MRFGKFIGFILVIFKSANYSHWDDFNFYGQITVTEIDENGKFFIYWYTNDIGRNKRYLFLKLFLEEIFPKFSDASSVQKFFISKDIKINGFNIVL